MGKPSATAFRRTIDEPDPFLGVIPGVPVILKFMKESWYESAKELDEQVGKQLEANMIAEKVSVLERHAKTGLKMQTLAMEYLDEHGVGSARNAIEMLVKGLEIERISVGAPKVAAKLMDMTDEQLLDELKQLVSGSPIVSTEANNQ